MKTTTLLIALLAFTFSYSNGPVEFVEKYKPIRGHYRLFKVDMAFDSDSISSVKPKSFKFESIYRVDYVATSPKNHVNGYQKQLNKKRWKNLREHLSLDETVEFEKHVVYQTQRENPEELFHGFVIYYRGSSKAAHESSFSSMGSLVNKINGHIINKNTLKVKIPMAEKVDSVFVGDIEELDKIKLARELHAKNTIIEWGYDSIGYDKKFYNAYYVLSVVSSGLYAAWGALTDKSIFNMLSRSKVTDKTLVVTDMTGSMSPYYSQLIVWHALKMSQGKKVKHVFFNDGDMKTTSEKKIGKTGGIYSTKTTEFLDVYRAMQKCMNGGYGGDGPENNLEAVKKGLRNYKDVDNVIMICDNWATPRDTSLIHSINKPIDFVMCGAEIGLNRDYVNLAYLNEGKITTIENSIADLNCLKENEEVIIGRTKFKMKKGRFSAFHN